MTDRPLTFALSGDLVAQDVELVDGSELVEHLAQVGLVHRPRDLADKHLDCVGVRLHLVGLLRACCVHCTAKYGHIRVNSSSEIPKYPR